MDTIQRLSLGDGTADIANQDVMRQRFPIRVKGWMEMEAIEFEVKEL
jgi:hypothetical protein